MAALPMEALSIETRSDGYQLRLDIGVESFTICKPRASKEDAEELRSIFGRALTRLPASTSGAETVSREAFEIAFDALEEIALAGMSLPMEACGDDEAKDRFHASQAWNFISIAARAREAIRARRIAGDSTTSVAPGAKS